MGNFFMLVLFRFFVSFLFLFFGDGFFMDIFFLGIYFILVVIGIFSLERIFLGEFGRFLSYRDFYFVE